MNRRKFSRLFFRLFFGLAFVAALSVFWLALSPRPEQFGPERAAALAAALAVIAALLSAWISQASREFIEDRELPDLRLFLDPHSRFQLFLLTLENSGSMTAYDVRLRWRDKPLQNLRGEEINFSIGALRPQAPLSKTLGVTHKVLERYRGDISEGEIEYVEYRGGRTKRKIPFKIDFGEYNGVPLYDQEALKTHYSLQQVPQKLEELNGKLEDLRKTLERREVGTGVE